MAKQQQTKAKNEFSEYKPPTDDLTITDRAAHFLDWAAKSAPMRPVTYQYLVKVSLKLPTLPKENCVDLVQFKKGKISGVKRMLLKKYKRTLVTSDKNPNSLLVRGVSLRASTDSEDVYRTTYTDRKAKVEFALNNLEEARDLMEVKELTKEARQQVKALDEVMKKDEVASLLVNLSTRPQLTEGK